MAILEVYRVQCSGPCKQWLGGEYSTQVEAMKAALAAGWYELKPCQLIKNSYKCPYFHDSENRHSPWLIESWGAPDHQAPVCPDCRDSLDRVVEYCAENHNHN